MIGPGIALLPPKILSITLYRTESKRFGNRPLWILRKLRNASVETVLLAAVLAISINL